MTTYRVGIDIGGTFTDFSVLNEQTGSVRILKTPSVPAKPEQAIFNGLDELFATGEIKPDQVKYFIHGTTLAVNTVIQRNGAKVALLVTAGFGDIMKIGRNRIPDIFNFFTEMPEPLVERSMVFEIPERSLVDGRVLRPVDEAIVKAQVDRALEAGAEAIAICFLHSYRNPDNELRAAEIVRAHAPNIYVVSSAEVWPQMREYERALITVINAYVGGKMKSYFSSLKEGVSARGVAAPILSTKSNGGIMTVEEAGLRPVETLLSGPASGVIGASSVGRSAGRPLLITFDMGGTSADVAVIEYEPRLSTEGLVGDFPVIMPAVDVTSIGAGGGSIVWTDATGVLKVGPRSAGAFPGPACYGLGGTDATITDAYACLNIIKDGQKLGDKIAISQELARQAVGRVASILGSTIEEAAESILNVATSQMYSALVPLLARKGVNFEHYALLPFGGAGPTHGLLLAKEVGIPRIVVPAHPGVLCATGSLSADFRKDFVRTVHLVVSFGNEEDVIGRLREAFVQLSAECDAWLNVQSIVLAERKVLRVAEARYLGQSFELAIPLNDALLADTSGAELRAIFHKNYEQVYGLGDRDADIEILDVRATAVGIRPKNDIVVAGEDRPAAVATPKSRREVFLGGRTWDTPIFDRDSLVSGNTFDGPAIILQYDTTTVVPDGYAVHVDRFGNLIAEKTDAE
jgi:N-methylhydantoinase A